MYGQLTLDVSNHNHPNLGVSKNSGTPKSSILIGFSIINHPFWGLNTKFTLKKKLRDFFQLIDGISRGKNALCRNFDQDGTGVGNRESGAPFC